MAWVDIPDADIDVGSFLREDLVTFRLRDNLRELRRSVLAWVFPEATTTSSTYVALAGTDLKIFIPDYADYSGLQRRLTVWIDYKVSGNSADYKIVETVSGNSGTALTGLTSTTYVAINLTIDVQSSWKGTMRTFQIQAKKTSGGTLYAQAVAQVAAVLEY